MNSTGQWTVKGLSDKSSSFSGTTLSSAGSRLMSRSLIPHPHRDNLFTLLLASAELRDVIDLSPKFPVNLMFLEKWLSSYVLPKKSLNERVTYFVLAVFIGRKMSCADGCFDLKFYILFYLFSTNKKNNKYNFFLFDEQENSTDVSVTEETFSRLLLLK